MFLTVIIILALASAAIELLLVYRIPKLRDLSKKYPLIDLGVSIGISVAVGWLFGASGMIVLCAAMLSTALTMPVYGVPRWWQRRKEARLRLVEAA